MQVVTTTTRVAESIIMMIKMCAAYAGSRKDEPMILAGWWAQRVRSPLTHG